MRISKLYPRVGATLLALSITVPMASAQSTAKVPQSSGSATVLAPSVEEAIPSVGARPKARRPVNPLYPRIAAMLETEREQLAALRTRKAGTRDDEMAMAIQREIEQIKTQTELGILRLQAEHARKQGKAAVAEGIEAAIRQMTQPAQRLQPMSRPAPATDSPSDPTR